MEITYIELFHKSGKELLHLQNGICSWNDIEIEYTKDGKIFIKADKSGIFGIRCHIANTYFDNPLILTDAWERAYGDLCWEPVSDRISPWYAVRFKPFSTSPEFFSYLKWTSKRETAFFVVSGCVSAFILSG